MTPEQFIEKLKDPDQARAKENVIEILKSADNQIYNIEYQQFAPNDYKVVVSINVGQS